MDSGYYYENQNYIKQYLPPLFRAELYRGELPKNCAWMAELSEKLRERPELSEKLVGRRLILMSDWRSIGGFDAKRGRYDEERYHLSVDNAFKIINSPEK